MRALALKNRNIGARKHTNGATNHRRLKPSFTPSQVATHIARIGRTTSRIRNAMLFTASFESETRAKLNQSADTSR